MNQQRQRMVAIAGLVAVSLLLVGFGTGFLALTESPRPVGRLRPADLQPAVSSATNGTDPPETDPVETSRPSSTSIRTPTTTLPTTTAASQPTTTPAPSSEPPHPDGDHDADD